VDLVWIRIFRSQKNAAYLKLITITKEIYMMMMNTVQSLIKRSGPQIAPALAINLPRILTYAGTRQLSTATNDELHKLSANVVKKIKAELMEADRNHDGRINAEELKVLLKKHRSTFTDKEIEELSELFYAAKAGGSVTYDHFIKAADYAVEAKVESKAGLDHNLHFKATSTEHPLGLGKCSVDYLLGGHPVYTPEELDIKLTHTPPVTFTDGLAFRSVKLLRFFFDTATRWNVGEITKKKVMLRTIYLETIAAVPGFVGAMIRHFRALRTMKRDGGWTNTLLEEAENEKLHLLTFIRMYEPDTLFRYLVIGGQLTFASFFFIAYLLSPTYCHRLVGYVEEEACSTYTKIIKAIQEAPEGTDLASWRTDIAPAIGRAYWHLGETGTVLDLMRAIRADEANHRDVNHLAAGIKPGQINPHVDPAAKLDQMLIKYVNDLMNVGRNGKETVETMAPPSAHLSQS